MKPLTGPAEGINGRVGELPANVQSTVDHQHETDVTALFHAAGIAIEKPILITETDRTYEYDSDPKNNWLYAGFRGFQELDKRLQIERGKCDSFVTVGTGSGLDAIGAYHILRPHILHLTDIAPGVIPVALDNFRRNTPGNVYSAGGAFGNLLTFMLIHGEMADVIYGNVPNLPARDAVLFDSAKSATFYDRRLIESCPEVLDRYRLALQYQFLSQAAMCLNAGGSAVTALGGRAPYQIAAELFQHAGLQLEDLFSMVKIQTQPEDVIPGYAEAEAENGVEFLFYDYDELNALGLVREDCTAAALQQQIAPYAFSAREAWGKFRSGRKIAHAVWILRGRSG